MKEVDSRVIERSWEKVDGRKEKDRGRMGETIKEGGMEERKERQEI